MTLYTLRYNNYYNRIKKGFDTVAEYQPFVLDTLVETNYNPRDGVTTTKTLNIADDKVPDYIIWADEDDTIVSRWFVIESNRTRRGQYTCSLLRDVIMDWKEQIYNSPLFIRRGFLPNGDPGIFLPEDVSVSQIKQSEHLLKDSTNTAWLVGYMAAPNTIIDGELEPETGLKVEYGIVAKEPEFTVPDIKDWAYYGYSNLAKEPVPLTRYDKITYTFGYDRTSGGRGTRMSFNDYGPISLESTVYGIESGLKGTDTLFGLSDMPLSWDYIYNLLTYNQVRSPITMAVDTQYGVSTNDLRYKYLKKVEGSVIKDEATNQLYSISLINMGEDSKQDVYSQLDMSAVGRGFYGMVQAMNEHAQNEFGQDGNILSIIANRPISTYTVDTEYTDFMVSLNPVSLTEGFEFTIPPTVKTLSDAPYRMFCIPYPAGASRYKITGQSSTYNASTYNALAIATSMMVSGGSRIYDVQLLPYCPIKELRDKGDTIDITNYGITNIDYIEIANAATVIFFCDKSQGTFNIPFTQDGPIANNPIATKANALTQFSRLCSPNYSGMFEYQPIKNNGVRQINVDYSYKPYNPYIHLNIDFNGLYGRDFDDARGLICGGDFSITRIDSAWTQYQLNNKNYNEIFNKNIDKMEFEGKYARTQDIVNAITGSFSGAASGAMTGAMSGGGPWGAIAGGVIGGGAAIGGGIADVMINEKMRQYNIDFTKDIQDLNLGNVKAIPYSLSKVSSFNKNNKIWPFVETYSCPIQEYRAVYERIQYYGMSINRIGVLSNYIANKPNSFLPNGLGYFQGVPIRLEDIQEDSHISNAIATELSQGVYL